MKRQIISAVMAGVALMCLNLWAWLVLTHQREIATRAQKELIVCQQLSERIQRLRDKPMIAGSHEIELTELSKRIEETAAGCQVPSSSLVRISPEPARRLGDTFYLEKPTTVVLEAVSLRQLAQFLYAMSTGSAAMDVQSLRITAPREQETGDHWSAEVTLSYLIYAPRQGASSADPFRPFSCEACNSRSIIENAKEAL